MKTLLLLVILGSMTITAQEPEAEKQVNDCFEQIVPNLCEELIRNSNREYANTYSNVKYHSTKVYQAGNIVMAYGYMYRNGELVIRPTIWTYSFSEAEYFWQSDSCSATHEVEAESELGLTQLTNARNLSSYRNLLSQHLCEQ